MSKRQSAELKLEPGRTTHRKNISITPYMLTTARLVMAAEGYEDFSDFISELIRERARASGVFPATAKPGEIRQHRRGMPTATLRPPRGRKSDTKR